ncbi:MAG: Lpg1974 family pore-forming outer membrane protein [Pirellulales bacterium]
MARAIALRAAAWLSAIMLCGWLGLPGDHLAMAQGVAPAPGQPMWINQPPMFQVGPNGAVNLDQPVMMPNTAYQGGPPMMYGPVPSDAGCAAQPYPATGATPYPAQAYPAPSAWVVPAQPVQQYPAAVMQPPAVVQPPLVVQPPPQPFTWTLFGEALWLHPTGVDMAHAQQQMLGVPFGLIGVADPSYDIGFRVGGEVQFAPDAAVFGSYAFFEENTISTVVAPVGGEVGSLVHHPGAGITTSAGPVDAIYDLEFQLGDLAYRQFLALDQLRRVSVFAGGRFGRLEQRFFQTGVFAGAIPGTIETSTNIEFTGGGPMAGFDAERMISASRFSVYGRALAAAITGQFDAHYRLFNATTVATLAEVFWEDDRIVPMLDYELGLAWTSPQGTFRFSAGYLASHWFNAVTTPVFVDAVQADNYVDVSDTISFDGLVGRAEVRW